MRKIRVYRGYARICKIQEYNTWRIYLPAGCRKWRLAPRVILGVFHADKPKLGIGGINTWGKGFWRARLLDETALRLAIAFVATPPGASNPESPQGVQ